MAGKSTEFRITSRPELYRQARQAATWGISVSLGLGLFKLLGGVFGLLCDLPARATRSARARAATERLAGTG